MSENYYSGTKPLPGDTERQLLAKALNGLNAQQPFGGGPYARVQYAHTYTDAYTFRNDLSLSFASANTAGNAILAVLAYDGTDADKAPVPVMMDTLGNTYRLVAHEVCTGTIGGFPTGTVLCVYLATSIKAGVNRLISSLVYSLSSDIYLTIVEYSGVRLLASAVSKSGGMGDFTLSVAAPASPVMFFAAMTMGQDLGTDLTATLNPDSVAGTVIQKDSTPGVPAEGEFEWLNSGAGYPTGAYSSVLGFNLFLDGGLHAGAVIALR